MQNDDTTIHSKMMIKQKQEIQFTSMLLMKIIEKKIIIIEKK
jgi:hypothetical protein